MNCLNCHEQNKTSVPYDLKFGGKSPVSSRPKHFRMNVSDAQQANRPAGLESPDIAFSGGSIRSNSTATQGRLKKNN